VRRVVMGSTCGVRRRIWKRYLVGSDGMMKWLVVLCGEAAFGGACRLPRSQDRVRSAAMRYVRSLDEAHWTTA